MKTIQLKEDFHAKIKKAAEIQGKTISNAIEESINLFYDKASYSKEEFAKFISRHPKLKIHNETLMNELDKATLEIIKGVMSLEEKCPDNIEFNLANMPNDKKDLESLFRSNVEEVYIIVKTGQKDESIARETVFRLTKMIEELSAKDISDKKKLKIINVTIALKKADSKMEDDKYELLIFACYKEKVKESENEKKEKN
mgnify:CR=1 FL=1